MEITLVSSEDGASLYQMVFWMEMSARMARTLASATVGSFESGK